MGSRVPCLEAALGAGASALGYSLHFVFTWAFYERYLGRSLTDAQAEEFTKVFWLSLVVGVVSAVTLATFFGAYRKRRGDVVFGMSIAVALALFWPYLELVSNVLLPK